MASFKLHENGYIYLHHWIDRKNRVKVSTKMKISSSYWDSKKGRPTDSEALYNGKNVTSEVVRYESTLQKALALQPELTLATLPQFRTLFQSLLSPTVICTQREGSLLSYYDTHLDRLKARKQSNYKAYKTCNNYLKEYFKGRKCSFKDINMTFYNDFTDYLTKKNLAMNTVANQFKLLKAVMQSAFMEGLHTNEAFRHFKKRMESADTIYLSEKELFAMNILNLTGHLEKARDFFIIGAFTGLRFEDWDRVSRDKIVDGVLTVRASKTGEVSTIPIHPFVASVLDKYNGDLPKKMSNQKMNEYIKVVAMRANIKDIVETRITKGNNREINSTEKFELVTTHTARRSLATNLILRGVSPYVVMKVTGHKSLSSFEKYVKLQELEVGIELKSLSFFN
jgi:site-specific recombinase XerD